MICYPRSARGHTAGLRPAVSAHSWSSRSFACTVPLSVSVRVGVESTIYMSRVNTYVLSPIHEYVSTTFLCSYHYS